MKTLLMVLLVAAGGCETIPEAGPGSDECDRAGAEVNFVWAKLESDERACADAETPRPECAASKLRERRAYTELWECRYLDEHGCSHLHVEHR